MSPPTVWIVLFRGVGGPTQLPTAKLRAELVRVGFEKVATYINSGNAVVTSDRPRAEVAARVAGVCSRAFGFNKDIHVIALEEWRALIDANPFPDAVVVPKLLHAAVLADDPPAGAIDALRGIAADGDRIAVVSRVAYLHTPAGFGTSKLAARFDRGIGVANTARNWNSVLKLLDLAEMQAAQA